TLGRIRLVSQINLGYSVAPKRKTMPKQKKEKTGPENRHQPLATQMSSSGNHVRKNISSKEGSKRRGRGDNDEEQDEYLEPGLTKRILEQAREQRDEMEQEMASAAIAGPVAGLGDIGSRGGAVGIGPGGGGEDMGSDESDDMDESDYDAEGVEEGGELGGCGENDYTQGIGMSEAEEKLVANFMSSAPVQRRTLADIIMEKIREKEEGEALAAGGEGQQEAEPVFPPKVVEVYGAIGKLLKNYTSGKLPKAFNIIPSLTSWEQILWLTSPHDWSAHAMLAATRLFASNFNPLMAQRFYNVFLLERCRDDIRENGRLNYHLYEAARKAVYKPAAFYRGIVLPLAAGGDCTLREASIFASVLARVSIPANHSAVALLKLAEMPYNGASSLFIRVLLNKKYTLPYKVIDALVNHFMAFVDETRTLPVLWHQSLLVFAQRYRGNVRRSDKDRMKELLRVQHHHQITPEVRRQLFMGGCRGDPKPGVGVGG
ncbi:unnamed protein product, partial [Discosporangium mesarthrocarpum]